ncbi:TPA: aconitate hydratase [Clostridioides difficile]|uniref:2,3-dimethylmalate dehydratase large subunit n=2 Tax=Clostridioides difficile TaxID=1496 RepID=A0A9X8WPP4_CLODI|nr:aconitate hydratase [Clostridioides difficile]EQG62602.1 aconitase family protein [Clostridioides difficile DA00149]EQI44946.1 aconitase family protein [Clostridioides difficile Y184]EQK93234.1 aconitase family protein [Clostridioides difficile CD127]AKP41887.1 aconitate hydratase [Clostridioides difficile ATCC 9689 = DSM 1296]AMM56215.1 aconitate hydratase [Clostridioides difficile]
MGDNIVYKIIKKHIVDGEAVAGSSIGIKIDQTLTQDSTGTMTYLQLEAMGIDKVKTKRSVAFVDHNMLQQGFENADDHKYIQTVADKYGVYFSKPGNGICHQVFLERFSTPGDTLLGSDSHTPTAGGVGMMAIGAGGLDVALAMAGGAYYIKAPKVCKVNLVGKLNNMVSSKDIILEVLRKQTVKGGVGKVYEYGGEGVKSLSVPQRATITNMGAELGATTSIFPSDEKTLEFFKSQGREEAWIELKPDADAVYDEEITINLDELKPLAAKPHSPDNVDEVENIGKIKIDQVAIGSCTNSSYEDLMKVAQILKGNKVHKDVSLVIAPGSRQVMEMIARNGALADIISAGARILENSCGPCIGMGQSPGTDSVSLRTFNRNFYGRSGTLSAQVYLVSPEVAAVSAIKGVLTDPREFDIKFTNLDVNEFLIDDSMIIKPADVGSDVEVVRGPNIKPFPLNTELSQSIGGKVILKTEDNITTDHIMPSNAKLLPFRSNIPYLANYCFNTVDTEFPQRAKDNNGGFIVGGDNYGQGSSREHAALAPLYLGVKGVIVKSFARIHKANLINSGIIPMEFCDEKDYENISLLDNLEIPNILDNLGSGILEVKNTTKGTSFKVKVELSAKEVDVLKAGGKLNYTKNQAN